jgi:hypothetical protein
MNSPPRSPVPMTPTLIFFIVSPHVSVKRVLREAPEPPPASRFESNVAAPHVNVNQRDGAWGSLSRPVNGRPVHTREMLLNLG